MITDHPILTKLKSLQLPEKDYAVMGTTCLYVRGLINTLKDVDIIARGEAWEKVKTLGDVTVPASGIGQVVKLFNNEIEAFNKWAPGDWNIDELIDSAEVTNGINFVSLEYFRKWKELKGSEKDMLHIKLLDEYIKSGKK